MFLSKRILRFTHQRKVAAVKKDNLFLVSYALLFTIAGLCVLPHQAKGQQPPPLPPNQLVIPVGQHAIPLQWQGDNRPGGWEPHAALLIPVKLPGVKRTFYMQFDTGSPYTLFYRSEMETLFRQYPSLSGFQAASGNMRGKTLYSNKHGAQQSNTRQDEILRRDIVHGDTLYGIRLTTGNLTFTIKAAPVRFLKADSVKDKHAPVIIGTIGTDLIENKVARLDYGNLQLILSDTITPAEKQQTAMSSFVFAGRRVLLPATLKGKQTLLYFDSGSSAFPLLTDKATCLMLAKDTIQVVRYPVQSWNATLTANTVTSGDSIALAGTWLPLKQVTWMEGASQSQIAQMARIGIGGMTGNQLFSNSCLLLDTRNKQFAILKGCASYSPSSP